MTLPVYIVRTSTRDNNVNYLRATFADPLFKVEALPGALLDTLRVWHESSYKSSHAIVVMDTSVSYLAPEVIRDRITTALTKAPDADIHYLCKWKDNCAKYHSVGNSNVMKWSTNPHGLQAVLLPPKTRDIILRKARLSDGNFFEVEDIAHSLTKAIRENLLKATVFVPNIVEFDVNMATSNKDFERLNQCQEEEQKRGSSTWTWVIVFALLLLFIIGVICFVARAR